MFHLLLNYMDLKNTRQYRHYNILLKFYFDLAYFEKKVAIYIPVRPGGHRHFTLFRPTRIQELLAHF